MSYVAVALARPDGGWVGRELDLDDVEDLDALVDVMRDVAVDAPVLLFVEEDDEYVGIVRVEDDTDPRVFLSDRRMVESSPIAAMLFAEAEAAPDNRDLDEDEEDEEGNVVRPVAEPAGDPDLLADFGVPAAQLLDLCAEEGMLPSDVISALCERAGCLEVLERVREG